MTNVYNSEFAEDCIHLKACRRLCKMIRKDYKLAFCRRCNENCSAYEPKQRLYTRDEVTAVMNGACRDGNDGYYPGDVCISDYIDDRGI